MLAALRGSSRTFALLAIVLGFAAGVTFVNYQSDRVLAQVSAGHAFDRFGNPWYPNWREDNARIERLDRIRPWLVWGGLLPSDLLLIASAVSELKQRRQRWFAGVALALGLGFAVLLALAWLASLMPGPAMIG
jgi:hypothetical protein